MSLHVKSVDNVKNVLVKGGGGRFRVKKILGLNEVPFFFYSRPDEQEDVS